MSKMRMLVYLIVIGMILVSGCAKPTQTPATPLPEKSGAAATATATRLPPTATPLPPTATPEPRPQLDPELKAAMKLCENVLPGQVCLVEGPVQVTAQPERNLRTFRKPGQILSLADIQTLKLGEAGSTKGLLVMRIQTEWPEGAFTALAFGDVELVNEVPFGTREFNPMQSLKLTTGPNKEGELPTSGFFVTSPEDGNLSTLVVNGAELSFGSTALLTSLQGGLTIQTVWGAVGAWLIDEFVDVIQGSRLDLTEQEIEQRVSDRYARYDPAYEIVKRALEKYEEARFWREYWERMNREDPAWKIVHDALAKYQSSQKIPKEDPAWKTVDAALKKYFAAQELRRKQKPWKGGWWKMTYGPVATNGKCKLGAAVGDGLGGGGGKPYTQEIPICRGNHGNTILMYESGASYDRVAPNLYAKSFISEFDLYGKGNYTTEGKFLTLQIVSPTRMVLSNANAEGGGCTHASAVYLDFVRDDPNVRCGEVIYVRPWDTPTPVTPTPTPQKAEPPVEGQYQARLSLLTKTCDPAAKPFAPSFKTAGLSLPSENKLVLDAASTKYELELSSLIYNYSSQKEDVREDRLGLFTLQQPVDDSFGLMMTLSQMPDHQWTGSWLVTNGDASKLCGGSIDLLPPP